MPGLRPGEIKILTCLQDGEKRFKDLRSETRLNPSILSRYLKTLQKLGLINRDVETRKYQSTEITVEILFFNEVLTFMQRKLAKMAKVGTEKSGSFPAGFGWVVLTEDVGEFQNILKTRLRKAQSRRVLDKITEIVEDLWDASVLSRFNKKEKETVQTYRDFLLKFVKRFFEQPSKKERRGVYKALFERTRARMASMYPGISIPDRMVYLDTAKKFREIYRRHDEILQPYSLEKLFSTMRFLKEFGQVRKDLSEQEIDELKSILSYLTDSRNKKIYERYLERIKNTPKTLIFYPSWGFRGYSQKLKELLPGVITKAPKTIH